MSNQNKEKLHLQKIQIGRCKVHVFTMATKITVYSTQHRKPNTIENVSKRQQPDRSVVIVEGNRWVFDAA